MSLFLLFVAFVVFVCIYLNKLSLRAGMPVLLAFILFGIVVGNNEYIGISFEDYEFAENACSFALILIMFYGGFVSSWSSAKKVVTEAGLLATAGVILTAAITGVLCHFLLHWNWIESLLLGSVISSTDAASVFSILRSRRLNLKSNTAPLLEIESGANDPCSFMLTTIMLSIMQGSVSAGHVVWMTFAQLFFGLAAGLVIAQGALFILRRVKLSSGFDSLFILAVAVFAYALPDTIGGNGYLSTYIVGIILGNKNFSNKKNLMHFFDGMTSMMQILIFFMLGLLARPAMLAKSIIPALVLFAVMFFVSRPLACGAILTPFKKYGFKQQMLVSFVGLRGASSIVFAIVATVGNDLLANDIFSTVFCIVLLSISLQGTFLPLVAKKLNMIDKNGNVLRTFNDFSDETNMQFSEVLITSASSWKGKTVQEIAIPKNLLFCQLIRANGERVMPKGLTLVEEGDRLILCSKAVTGDGIIDITEEWIDQDSKWAGVSIKEYPADRHQVILIKRANGHTLIPHGDTILQAGDVLYINKNIQFKK